MAAVNKMLEAFHSLGGEIGTSLASSALTSLLPAIAGFLFVKAIIFTIFEEDLVDGIRAMLHATLMIVIIAGLLTHWTEAGDAFKAMSRDTTGIVAEKAGLSGDNDLGAMVANSYLKIDGAFEKAWSTKKMFPGSKNTNASIVPGSEPIEDFSTAP